MKCKKCNQEMGDGEDIIEYYDGLCVDCADETERGINIMKPTKQELIMKSKADMVKLYIDWENARANMDEIDKKWERAYADLKKAKAMPDDEVK